MRFFSLLAALMICSGCAQTTGIDREDRQYKRIEYLETVYLPASQACSKAGGFMIFDDPAGYGKRPVDLSYADMRIAVARGCAGT